jgi:predicted O-methyltransferase YrrM
MRSLRRKLEAMVRRGSDRLDAVSRRDEDIVLAALATPELLRDLHDPVAFVSLLRGCLGRATCEIADIKHKANVGSLQVTVDRFAGLLDGLKNLPPLDPKLAVSIGRAIDGHQVDRRPAPEGPGWAGDVGTHFRLSSCPPSKGRILAAIARIMRCERGLEIGTAYGLSAMFMLTALRELHTFEGNELPSSIARTALAALYPGRAHCHCTLSHEGIPRLGLKEGGIDFFFHDGIHTAEAYRQDFALVLPYLAPGAVVLFDDIHWEDLRLTKGPANTYAGWRAVVDHPRVLRAIELDGVVGLALLGD